MAKEWMMAGAVRKVELDAEAIRLELEYPEPFTEFSNRMEEDHPERWAFIKEHSTEHRLVKTKRLNKELYDRLVESGEDEGAAKAMASRDYTKIEFLMERNHIVEYQLRYRKSGK